MKLEIAHEYGYFHTQTYKHWDKNYVYYIIVPLILEAHQRESFIVQVILSHDD